MDVQSDEVSVLAHDMQNFCNKYGSQPWRAQSEEIRALSLGLQSICAEIRF
jgi:hypothetical protein